MDLCDIMLRYIFKTMEQQYVNVDNTNCNIIINNNNIDTLERHFSFSLLAACYYKYNVASM